MEKQDNTDEYDPGAITLDLKMDTKKEADQQPRAKTLAEWRTWMYGHYQIDGLYGQFLEKWRHAARLMDFMEDIVATGSGCEFPNGVTMEEKRGEDWFMLTRCNLFDRPAYGMIFLPVSVHFSYVVQPLSERMSHVQENEFRAVIAQYREYGLRLFEMLERISPWPDHDVISAFRRLIDLAAGVQVGDLPAAYPPEWDELMHICGDFVLRCQYPVALLDMEDCDD